MGERLRDLPNLSKVNEEKLIAAGIETPEALRALGAKEALLRVRRTCDPGACLMMLWGLEGAVRGVPKKELPEDVKAELKAWHGTLPKEGV